MSNSEETPKPEASIEIKDGSIIVKCPLTDKILAYGVLECAHEEVAKYFYAQAKMAHEIKKASEESGRGIFSRLNLSGLGRR